MIGRRIAVGAGVAALALVAVVAGIALPLALPVTAQAAEAEPTEEPDYEATLTLVREHLGSDGTTEPVDERTVTVTVDKTADLQNRERIRVAWTGAHPTHGRRNSPYGEKGMDSEYPVVILLCRGVADPTLTGGELLSPETCWTTSLNERMIDQSASEAIWARDRFADPARVAIGGSASPWPSECMPDTADFRRYLLPFRAVGGKTYWNCFNPTVTTTAPEQSTDAALLANEIFATTAHDGSGTTLFEVRTDEVNASLGCSDTVPCSLVVIPIAGISCNGADTECREGPRFNENTLVGDLGDGTNGAVSGRYWWSESNWRNRFVVPLDFAPSHDVCDILDSRPPVSFYGSELLSQATLQWAPAYCLRQDRFKFRHNRSSEALGRRQLGTADAVAAFVSEPVANASQHVAYAPTAVTGFGIGYVVDDANTSEVTRLRLTPRLVTKLLTESYPATSGVRNGHCDVTGDTDVEVLKSTEVPARDDEKLPLAESACEIRTTNTRTETVDGESVQIEYTAIAEGVLDLADNPLGITSDPEFVALNPGIPVHGGVSEAVLVTLSEDSDTVHALTAWIAADAQAMAFIGGEPDENGMRVNGYYRGLSLPLADWPLLDRYVAPSGQLCIQQLGGSTPTLQRYASPVNSLKKTAEALLEAWPYSQVNAEATGGTTACKWIRDPLPYGKRFMLAVVPLGEAARYGLRVAELRTGTWPTMGFQGPTEAAMDAALSAFSQDGPGKIFAPDYTKMPATGYPGTMIVHTAALTDGLDDAGAAHVARFIRTATTEGQVQGRGNGQLPEGYLPIEQTGSTAPLFAAAQLSAKAIETQDTSWFVTPGPSPSPTPPPTVTPIALSPNTPVLPPVTGLPGAGDPTVDGLPADEEPSTERQSASALTMVDRSSPAGAAVPAMLTIALAGAAAAPMVRRLPIKRGGR